MRILKVISIPLKLVAILVIAFGVYLGSRNIFVTTGVNYGPGLSYRSLPEDSMDILVLGSSHAQFSFVPSFVYNDTGLYSYVLGSACQPLEVSLEMLKEGLKTQSPKMVILEVYTAMPLRVICEANSSYVTAAYLMTGEERYNSFDYLDEAERNNYYNDYYVNHNNWTTIESIEDLKQKNMITEDSLDTCYGYIQNDPQYPYDNYWHASPYSEIEEVATLDELDLASLNAIYDICQDRDIELVLYKTPVDGNDEINKSYLNAVDEWSKEKGVTFINFYELQEELDFYMWIHSDSYHAFTNGANIITTYLIDYIKEDLSIFNHHDNSYLDERYRANNRALAKSLALAEYNPKNYLRRFSAFDEYILFKFEYEGPLDDSVKDDLYALGIDPNFNFDRNYYAILKDGNCLYSSYSELNVTLEGKDISIGNTISIDDNILDSDSMTLVVLDDDMSIYLHKIIDYYPHLWDRDYDFYTLK